MIGAALAGGLIDRTLATTLISAVAISMLAIPGLAKLGARIGSAPRGAADARAPEIPPEQRVVARHHCRLRPRRRADRRHARPARNPVHRGRLGRPRDVASQVRRQAGLLRRRGAGRIPAPLRARDGARRRRHHGFAQGQRSGGRDDAASQARDNAGRPRPRRRARPRALRARRDRRGARDHRGEPAALGGGAGRSRRADGSRYRLDP